jgi:hypothetical protein
LEVCVSEIVMEVGALEAARAYGLVRLHCRRVVLRLIELVALMDACARGRVGWPYESAPLARSRDAPHILCPLVPNADPEG